MHFTPKTALCLITVLSALFNEADAVRQPKAIWRTKCWDVKTTRANSKDCSGALNMLEEMAKAGGVQNGPYDGCKQITWNGDCGIEVCNQRPSGTSISIGSILAAAQIQDSLCRADDGATGGITAIEGFENWGQEHTYAEVHLATSSLTKKNDPHRRRSTARGMSRDVRQLRATSAAAIENERSLVQRDEEWVRNTLFVVREQWANWDSATDGDLSRQTQSTLTDRLNTNWIMDLGHSTTRRSAIGRASDSEGHTWTLTFHAAVGSNVNSVPIVDRRPIIDSLFTLRSRIGRDHLGPPNVMTASVVNQESQTVIGHLTMVMVGDVPVLDRQIEMPGLRGVVIQVSGISF